MIRRPSIDRRGNSCWALISQVDHARLAAQVAEVWGAEPYAPLAPRKQVLPAIEHHDDGWSPWERRPQVEDGRPIDFLEMPLETSLSIWQTSIDIAGQFGPLASVMVARHFSALLRRFDSWRDQGAERASAAEAFLARQDVDAARWLAAWRASCPETEIRANAWAESACAELPWFDRLSLWLCCAPRQDPVTLDRPSGLALTITPDPDDVYRLEPWPLLVPQLDLTVNARQVPLATYASAEELAAAPAETVTFRWRLQAGR